MVTLSFNSNLFMPDTFLWFGAKLCFHSMSACFISAGVETETCQPPYFVIQLRQPTHAIRVCNSIRYSIHKT